MGPHDMLQVLVKPAGSTETMVLLVKTSIMFILSLTSPMLVAEMSVMLNTLDTWSSPPTSFEMSVLNPHLHCVLSVVRVETRQAKSLPCCSPTSSGDLCCY